MKKILVLVSVISMILQCAICKAGFEPTIPGLNGTAQIIADALVTKFGGEDPPVPASGTEGPIEKDGFQYRGSPWECINFVNGDVHVGTKSGIHRLRIIKSEILDNNTYKFIKECIDISDPKSYNVECDESIEWNLKRINHTVSGICIDYASGTMKGRPMDESKADFIVTVMAGIGIALLL